MKRSKPAKKTRKQQKEATGKLILKAARELFLELGYEKTTMRAIAKKAGVGTGSAFSHFPDKKALLAATLYNDFEEALTQAMAGVSPEAPLLDTLIHHFHSIFSQLGRTPELSKVLIKESLFARGEWAERVDMLWIRCTGVVQQFFESLKERGLLHADSDCGALSVGVMALYSNTLVLGLKQGTTAEEQVSTFRSLLKTLLFGHYSSPPEDAKKP